jgi:hypothetical protein
MTKMMNVQDRLQDRLMDRMTRAQALRLVEALRRIEALEKEIELADSS